jgi:hypothetical protein
MSNQCTCDSEGCCQQSSPPPTPQEPRIEGRTHLEITDLYNDLCNGVRHWLRTKTSSDQWDEYDESLSRWIDASEHQVD